MEQYKKEFIDFMLLCFILPYYLSFKNHTIMGNCAEV